MAHCIYCLEDKGEDEFSLEHVLPQFLGGAFAPDAYKTNEVCRRCNSNLGLFVDASFEKTWIVSNKLRSSAIAFFDPDAPTALPLICMGTADLSPSEIPEGHVCEIWIGALGEQVFWIRPHDTNMSWYVGGNPRTVKKLESRAYFLFSERSHKNAMVPWLSFERAFEGRKVKKIMCTTVEGANPSDIGFSTPDELDLQRIKYFTSVGENTEPRKQTIEMHSAFDQRFMSKLAIGVSYCLFGAKVLDSEYGKELHKGLWHKNGEAPRVRGVTALGRLGNRPFDELIGFPNAVTLAVLASAEGVVLNLNLGTDLNWTVLCASRDALSVADLEKIGEGKVIVLLRPLQIGTEMDLPLFLAHKTGAASHPKLAEIESRANKHLNYFKNL